MNAVFTALVPALQVWRGQWRPSGDGNTWANGRDGYPGGGAGGGAWS